MTWYCIETIYKDPERGICIYRKKNMTGPEVLSFRENVFRAGLYIPSESNPLMEGKIVSPFDVVIMHSYKQQKKFE